MMQEVRWGQEGIHTGVIAVVGHIRYGIGGAVGVADGAAAETAALVAQVLPLGLLSPQHRLT